MTLEQFADTAKITESSELDRALLLAFFHSCSGEVSEFSVNDVCGWLGSLSLPMPNKSRLAQKLEASSSTIRGSSSTRYKLRREYLKAQQIAFPDAAVKSQVVIDLGTILPEALYAGSRSYIVSLAKQINASYEHNIFDGCAVLMRRLEEVLLISAYENKQIEASIKDAEGNYSMLEGIVRNAVGNSTLNLSRNSKQSIDVFRVLGNFSAHKITYTCKREYIAEKIDSYRALIDELLHKAGFKG